MIPKWSLRLKPALGCELLESEGQVPVMFVDLSSLPRALSPPPLSSCLTSCLVYSRKSSRSCRINGQPTYSLAQWLGLLKKGFSQLPPASSAQALEWGKFADRGPTVWNWYVISMAHHQVTFCNTLDSKTCFCIALNTKWVVIAFFFVLQSHIYKRHFNIYSAIQGTCCVLAIWGKIREYIRFPY